MVEKVCSRSHGQPVPGVLSAPITSISFSIGPVAGGAPCPLVFAIFRTILPAVRSGAASYHETTPERRDDQKRRIARLDQEARGVPDAEQPSVVFGQRLTSRQPTDGLSKPEAGHGLKHRGSRCEQEIGNRYRAGDVSDERAWPHEHEKGDADSRAEQHGGTE